MKFYTTLALLISSILSAHADSFTISNAYSNVDFLTQQAIRNQYAGRDRRTEASAAVLLGIIDPASPTYEGAVGTNFESHDLAHGLGEGLIINDPDYFKPVEKTATQK